MLANVVAAAAMALSVAAASGAQAEGRYANARFGYVVEIPKGFSEVAEADNSDGGTASSADGAAQLAVWGANLLDATFASDVGSRIASDASDGWALSFRTVGKTRAAWSGAKGDRIVYTRAIALCRDQAAYVRLEYDRSAAKRFDPVVTRLARSLKPARRCA